MPQAVNGGFRWPGNPVTTDLVQPAILGTFAQGGAIAAD
jgi:hypothetical protein